MAEGLCLYLALDDDAELPDWLCGGGGGLVGQEFWEPEHVLSLAKSLRDLKVPSFVIYRFLAAQSLPARLPITSQKEKDLLFLASAGA